MQMISNLVDYDLNLSTNYERYSFEEDISHDKWKESM